MKNCRCLIAGQRQFVYILFHFLIIHDIASGGGCFHKQRPLSLEKITAAKGESFRRSVTLTDVYFQGS